jgi:competence protein ComEC
MHNAILSIMDITRWRYHRFHVSYLLAWFAAGLLGGLMIGQIYEFDVGALLLFIGLVLLLGALRSGRWWAVPIIVASGLSLGILRGNTVAAEYDTYNALVGQKVTVLGVMGGDAQRDSGGRQKIILHNVTIGNTPYPGEVFITAFSDASLKRGDALTVEGNVREGFASYGATLSSGKILKTTRGDDLIRDIRERFSETVRALVIEPMASLGLGFVVGQRSTLPDSLDEQLKVVGLTHIVVASGYNLTILVRFMMRLLARHSRYLAFTGSLLMILAFVLFSGFSPSMNRAVIVTVLGLLAWYVGRRFHPVLLIAYVAAATAVFNPMYVWADLGWYLSFFAFAGILVVAPLVMNLIYRRRKPSSFEQLVFETMSAEVAALPLVVFAFSTIPVFALVANVLVAPFIPAAMALTALTGILGMISTAIAVITALPTTILIGYMIAVVEWLSALPAAEYALDLGTEFVLMWYVLLVGFCLYVSHKLNYDFRARDTRLEI